MPPLIARPGLPLVGLVGRKRHGKDTLADVLIERAGFVKAGFADPLREAVLATDPIVGHEVTTVRGWDGDLHRTIVRPIHYSEALRLHGYEDAKDVYPEFRRVLQTFGTDGIRALDPEFWVRQAVARIDARTTPYVLTDVRFPNEADAIRERGGFLIRVVRPDLPVDPDEHESESALDGYSVDLDIRNDGTLEEFQAEARALARSLGSFRTYPL